LTDRNASNGSNGLLRSLAVETDAVDEDMREEKRSFTGMSKIVDEA
jgi:hypothetical protein